MEAHYRAFGGKLVIKVEGSTIKDLFEQIGPVAEVLDGDDCCGKCGSVHIYPRAREAQGFTYYELVCSDCRAKLSFGQHKDGGTLWAKRTDEHGNALDHRGWIVYLGIAAPAAPPAPVPKTQPAKAPAPTNGNHKPRPVPEELQVMFANIEKDSKHTAEAFKMLEDAMRQSLGERGGIEYNRMVMTLREKHPKGTAIPLSAIKDCLLDMFEAAYASTITDSDLPEILR